MDVTFTFMIFYCLSFFLSLGMFLCLLGMVRMGCGHGGDGGRDACILAAAVAS